MTSPDSPCQSLRATPNRRMSEIALKHMESWQFAPWSGFDLAKLSILARFCNTFVTPDPLEQRKSVFGLLAAVSLYKTEPINQIHFFVVCELPLVRNATKTNGILTSCSFERPDLGENVNISKVLQYLFELRFPLRIRLANPSGPHRIAACQK